jgi:SAM-dependent methyltransferase
MPVPPDDGVSFYSRIAPEFHASYEIDANRAERMRVWKQFLDRYATTAHFAYDIGCGSGVLACELATRGIETVGIDGAAGMLSIAQRVADARRLANVSFQQHRLPLPSTSKLRRADIVVSSSAIEYLDSIPEALSFLHGLLDEGGVVVFSISNRDSVSRRLVRAIHHLTGRPRYLRFLRHFMTLAEVKSAVAAANLSYLEHAYFGRADRLNRVLGYFAAPRFASNMLIVAARKARGDGSVRSS